MGRLSQLRRPGNCPNSDTLEIAATFQPPRNCSHLLTSQKLLPSSDVLEIAPTFRRPGNCASNYPGSHAKGTELTWGGPGSVSRTSVFFAQDVGVFYPGLRFFLSRESNRGSTPIPRIFDLPVLAPTFRRPRNCRHLPTSQKLLPSSDALEIALAM